MYYLKKKRKLSCIILCLFTLLLLTPNSFADVVTIGTRYSIYDHIPIEPYYSYTYSQCIYLQSDINAGGSIYIDSIKYHWNGCSGWTDAIKVYMGHTTERSFSSNSDCISVDSMNEVN